MSRQRRLATLVQTGIGKLGGLSVYWVEAFDLVLQVPEESIPANVADAALQLFEWLLHIEFTRGVGEKPDPATTPPWISEWLERENRPNPFA